MVLTKRTAAVIACGGLAVGCAPPSDENWELDEAVSAFTSSSLMAESGATITGVAGGGKVLFQAAGQKVCWNGVDVASAAGATVRYATGESDGDQLQLSYGSSVTSQTDIGAAIATTNAPSAGWELAHMKNASVSFAALSGSATLCIRAKNSVGGWVASVEKVTLTGTSGGTTGGTTALVTLEAENGTVTGAVNQPPHVLFQAAAQKVCWSGVNVAGVTSFEVRYGQAEPETETFRLSFGSTVQGTVSLPTNGNWTTYTGVATGTASGSGTQTVCLESRSDTPLGGWVASIDKVVLKGTSVSTPPPVTPAPGTLLWKDEFDGTCMLGGTLDQNGLCKNHWYYNHEAYFNNEWQEYVTEAEAYTYGVVKRVNGVMQINAKNINGKWWSARMITKDKYEPLKGRIEARLRLPTWPTPERQGPWPAFWMLGHDINELPTPGLSGWMRAGAEEIDIFEAVVNQGPHRIDANIIADDNCAGGSRTAPCSYPWPTRPYFSGWPKAAPVTNFTNWHTYALEWTPTRLQVYQDGVSFGSVDPSTQGAGPVFQQKMYILFNLAIGGTLGGDATGLPNQTMEIDWIRHTAL